MKAVKITQQIKDLNAKLYPNLTVDSIRTFSNIPKSFYSPTYNIGQRTDGYNTLSNTIHEADGFYNVITPVYDVATQKLGSMFFDVDKFTYAVENKTQEEIDAYEQQQLDADTFGSRQNRRQSDAQEMINRFFAVIHRRVDSGTLTAGRAVKTSNYMLTGLQFLQFGEMELAKNSFNNIDLSSETAANQTAIQEIITLGIEKIQAYLDSEV